MKVGVTSAALEYGITVTALSLPIVILGYQFANFVDAVYAVYADLLGPL